MVGIIAAVSEVRMQDYSLVDWYRLDGRDRARVLKAIDQGERVDEERLRPAALAMAEAMAHGWGIRKPLPTAIAIGAAFAAIISFAATQRWWAAATVTAVAVVASAALRLHTQHQARRHRPAWMQAITVNQP